MQVRLTDEQAQALKRLAAERGTSVAAVIRDAVDRELAERVAGHDPWRRALAARSYPDREGATDLSERHDGYLDDPFGRRLSCRAPQASA